MCRSQKFPSTTAANLQHPSLTAAMHTKDPLYAPTMYVYGQDTAPAMYSKKRKENR